MKKVITISIFLMAATIIHADTEVVDGITWTYSVLGDAVSVGGGSTSSTAVPKSTVGAINIPSALGGKPVTGIGNYAFWECEGLTSVTIPNSVTSIGEHAFNDCAGLTSITIPDSVKYIRNSAFVFCSGLKAVNISNLAAWCRISFATALSSNPLCHAHNLYLNGALITELEIPHGVTHIGDIAFSHCSGLTSITIPESVTNIGYLAFYQCSKLTCVTIPDSVTSIGESVFACCSGITNIIFRGDCPAYIGERSVYDSSDRVTTYVSRYANGWDDAIAAGTWMGCPITYLDVEDDLVPCDYEENLDGTIRFDKYTGSNVNEIYVPQTINGKTVSSISSLAFVSCAGLKSITIPPTVTWIDDEAFAFRTSLNSVTYLGDAPDVGIDIYKGTPRSLVTYVNDGSIGWNGGISSGLPAVWCERGIAYADGSSSGDSPGDLMPSSCITNYVYSTVTNYVYNTVTNVIHVFTTVTNVVKYVPEPGTSPDAGYGINVGAGGETVIAGVAGWDAFGVPDGMEWNKETGTLSGGAKLSGAYDLILVSGSGADTKIMRTTLTVSPYDKIVGYVGVAFSQGGAPLNNLKSYRTLPAGLKWKGGVLNGVPTKAQTLDLETVDGEPVKIEIKALPDSVVGTFDGCVYLPPSDPTNGVANTCDIIGTITLSATAAGKISASVKTAKKTYSFSMASWTKFADGDAFTLEAGAELKTGEKLQVNATVCDGATVVFAKLSGGEFGDDGCVTVLAKDVYAKSGSKWIDEEAHALMATCKGTYQFGFDAVENESAWMLRPVAKAEAAFLKVVLKDTGVATISGTLPDKTKVNLSAKATASAVDGSDKVEIWIVSVAFSGKITTLPMEISVMNDGSPAKDRTNCGIIHSVKR